MKRVCLLVVLLLATIGPTGVTGQDQRPFTGVDPLRQLLVAPRPSEVAEQEATGNNLLRDCRQNIRVLDGEQVDFDDARHCQGLVRGVWDMAGVFTASNVCTPAGVNVGQLTRVVVRYLNDHPQDLPERDTDLILRALQDAFPCR